MPRFLKQFLAWMASALLGVSGPAAAQSGTPLSFGVLNQQSPILTAERWNPILRYLTLKTGIPLTLKMGATVALTDAMMAREEFDFVYTNHSFQSGHDGRYKVIARWGGDPIRGTIVVLDDSPARTILDLRGRTMAFPSQDAFVGYAVPTVALKERGVRVRNRFAGNQEGALAQLKARRVQAAAVNSRFLHAYAHREHLPYRIIYQSAPFQELPVLAHPRVPESQVQSLRAALLAMAGDPAAAEILRQAKCPGFEAASESDYDSLRQIYKDIGK